MIQVLLVIVGVLVLVFQQQLGILIHEAGHLFFGKMSRYEFVSFRIYRFVWFKSQGKIRFKTHKNSFAAGQCLMVPPSDYDKFKYKAYNMGGGIFNILAYLIFSLGLILYVVFSDTEVFNLGWHGSFGSWFVQIFLFTGAFMNGVYAIINLLPIVVGGVPTDGRNIKEASKSKLAKRAFYLILYVNNQMASGKRYRDLPSYLPKNLKDNRLNNFLIAWLVLLEASRLEDLGQYEAACEQLKRISDKKLPRIYADEIKLNLIYFYLVYTPDRQKARQLYEDKKNKKLFENILKVPTEEFSWVAAAIEYYILDDKEKALAIIEKAKRLVKNRPNIGERQVIEDVLEDLGVALRCNEK